ncbi:uncharacterized protein [Blastocystis hominis]|uniref:Uncharacterized protein n=1 Tax=Blastocystis hominis TaxID=12968 RepID=D8M3D0_BLAHO|nr:uncharacterized protein [Blastocystis hominis]CBK22403.2 unnamed protein product [Blastocystis hominis]|eukprot:XP_012896451.1 uncharacterized protein [Blastocystis hominis]
MAILMGKMLGVSTDHIHPQLTVTSNVKRPYNCHLDCSELRATGCFVMRDFEEGLREVFGNAGLLPKDN